MVADHAYDLRLQLAEAKTAQQIHHAMRQTRYHDDHPIASGEIVEMPFKVFPRQQSGKGRLDLRRQFRNRAAQAFEVDSPEKVAVLVLGMLVRGDNIAAQIEQMAGDARDDTRSIDAGDE